MLRCGEGGDTPERNISPTTSGHGKTLIRLLLVRMVVRGTRDGPPADGTARPTAHTYNSETFQLHGTRRRVLNRLQRYKQRPYNRKLSRLSETRPTPKIAAGTIIILLTTKRARFMVRG